MEYQDSTKGDFESTLKRNARQLVDSLEKGDVGEAVQLINELNKTRDHGLYHEVGKLTRELHNAIVNFKLDPRLPHASEVSQIADATDRLNYVVTMTEKAANRTMDLVELSSPLVSRISSEAQTLSDDWGRFMRREMDADGFRDLTRRIEPFLANTAKDGAAVTAHLNDIVLAQDYQDLTGQVIKRVTQLVTEVESNLLKLVLMASHVDSYAGIEHDESAEPNIGREEKVSNHGEGPQIHADKLDDVAACQDDVDDLLSSLGF